MENKNFDKFVYTRSFTSCTPRPTGYKIKDVKGWFTKFLWWILEKTDSLQIHYETVQTHHFNSFNCKSLNEYIFKIQREDPYNRPLNEYIFVIGQDLYHRIMNEENYAPFISHNVAGPFFTSGKELIKDRSSFEVPEHRLYTCYYGVPILVLPWIDHGILLPAKEVREMFAENNKVVDKKYHSSNDGCRY